jgi:hypothetical protein
VKFSSDRHSPDCLYYFEETSMSSNMTPEDIERLAHRRAARKMGWYIHALVYIAVNIGLALLSSFSGRHWAVFPALGWGLGLLIHGLVVFVAPPGSQFREGLVQRERQRLQEQNRR